MLLWRSPLVLLTSTKEFENPWVGHVGLNRLGVHTARMRGADAMWRLRRLQQTPAYEAIMRDLDQRGVAVVRDFLPQERFLQVQNEVRARAAEVEATHPIRYRGDHGFGPRRPFPGGFDRWDGGTLNRFIRVNGALPRTASLARELRRLGARSVGTRLWAEPVRIYQTVFTAASKDIQMRAHRDTFQPAMKLWFFLEDVGANEAFEYAPGSHRLTPERLQWETEQAHAAAQRRRGGSFRISERDLSRYGLPPLRPYPVGANTLIVANVRGFHRRGHGRPGARRLALYGNFRPGAFLPVPL